MTTISSLTALTGAGVDAAADLLPIVDMSLAGTSRNKKILVSELKLSFNLGTAADLDIDTDDTLAADSDSLIPTQQAVKAYVDANVGGGITELDDVPDVNAPTPADGDVLTWDATPGEWVPAAPTGGSNALDDLTDVDAPTPADGDVLTFDSGSGDWVPVAPSGGTSTETLISSVTTSGSQANVTFSSIPGTYKHLIIRVLGRSSAAGANNDELRVQLNGDTTASYAWVRDGAAQVGGAFASGQTAQTSANIGYVNGATAAASVPGFTQCLIPHYAGTAWKKAGWSKFLGGDTTAIFGGNVEWIWNNTAAITSIFIDLPSTNTFVDGSIVELIGVSY